jgi:hypothetical protein
MDAGLEAPFIDIEAIVGVTPAGFLDSATDVELSKNGRFVAGLLKPFWKQDLVFWKVVIESIDAVSGDRFPG